MCNELLTNRFMWVVYTPPATPPLGRKAAQMVGGNQFVNSSWLPVTWVCYYTSTVLE